MTGWTGIGSAEGRASLSAVVVDGQEVGVARLPDGNWAAFDNSCTHEECPLSDGDLDGDQIVCYCHGATFDLRSGAVLEGPALEPLTLFETRVEDGELQVKTAS